MHRERAIGPVVEQQAFVVETDQLRPGVPLVRVRGRLDLAAADTLRLVVDECLDHSPWAIVLDLSALVELRDGAVQALVDLACRAGQADIGLYLVTTDTVVENVLDDGETKDLFDIHHSIESAERTLHGNS
jgi:anti-anti-sigma factor